MPMTGDVSDRPLPEKAFAARLLATHPRWTFDDVQATFRPARGASPIQSAHVELVHLPAPAAHSRS
jgi:hypothetical protein